jgi:hypothetical protein
VEAAGSRHQSAVPGQPPGDPWPLPPVLPPLGSVGTPLAVGGADDEVGAADVEVGAADVEAGAEDVAGAFDVGGATEVVGAGAGIGAGAFTGLVKVSPVMIGDVGSGSIGVPWRTAFMNAFQMCPGRPDP